MAEHHHLALPNNHNEGIWSYYEFLQVCPIVLDGHLVIILKVPLIDKSFVMNVNKAYNLPILHCIFQQAFQYSLQGEYFVISSDSDYATLASEQAVLLCVLTKGHMCLLHTALYPNGEYNMLPLCFIYK